MSFLRKIVGKDKKEDSSGQEQDIKQLGEIDVPPGVSVENDNTGLDKEEISLIEDVPEPKEEADPDEVQESTEDELSKIDEEIKKTDKEISDTDKELQKIDKDIDTTNKKLLDTE